MRGHNTRNSAPGAMDPPNETHESVWERIRRMETRIARSERWVTRLRLHQFEHDTLSWILGTIINLIIGTIEFLGWMLSFAWPIAVMLVVIVIVSNFRRHAARILFQAIIDIMKGLLATWDGIADVIRGIISGVRFFGVRHVHKRDVPKFHVHDVFPGGVYAFMKHPVRYCSDRVVGVQFVWGAVIYYASPEMCHACTTLSLAPALDGLCTPVYFSQSMYSYFHMACKIEAADIACQVLYLDVFAEQLIGICVVAGGLLAYRPFLADIFRAVWLMLHSAWDLGVSAVVAMTTADPQERSQKLHEAVVRNRRRWHGHMPPQLQERLQHTLGDHPPQD